MMPFADFSDKVKRFSFDHIVGCALPYAYTVFSAPSRAQNKGASLYLYRGQL